jgi:hypothetical protein
LQKIYDVIEDPYFEIIVPKLSDPYYVGLTSVRIKKVLRSFLEEMAEGELGVE